MSNGGPHVAVIGCGIFGAMVALRLASSGFQVTIYERRNEILGGASYNNQNRLHLGFHYPRDRATALQCKAGFVAFTDAFPEAIRTGFPNVYCIASEGSYTDPQAYLDFCDGCDLRYQRITPQELPIEVSGVALSLLTDEAVYDCGILRRLISAQIQRSEATPKLGQAVVELRRTFAGLRVCCESGESADFDAVVNCSYADIGRLTAQLGYTVPARRYEYTVIPIIDWLPHPFGMTVMDGPFFTVLPFGKTSQHLLYHVTHSVVAESTQELMNSSWLANDAPSLAADNIDRIFAQMRADAEGFVPSLREATMVGYLHGPRMVLKDAEVTDARPSIAQWHDDRYVTVFSGKVDHSILVADSLARQMATQFGVREGRGLA